MYLYRDEKAKKALHLYSIPECEVHLWKGELRLSHARLNNLVILLPETKFPVDELL
jgi:hypothetical protein